MSMHGDVNMFASAKVHMNENIQSRDMIIRRKRLKIARTWSTLLLEQAETRSGSSLHEL